MIQDARLHHLNENAASKSSKYVLYWMQASQRTHYNHALEYAIRQANEAKLPVIVVFGLMDDYPDANARHYAFMLEGLRDVSEALKKRGILFVLRHAQPADAALSLARDAALLVCDRGYLRHQKAWRDAVADSAPCPVVEVETDAIVPVEEASPKQEIGARTLRAKLHRQWPTYMVPLKETKAKHSSVGMRLKSDMDVTDPPAALAKLKLDRTVAPSKYFTGGQVAAQKKLKRFLSHSSGYATSRNEPSEDRTTQLAAYLHFGQISALDMALAARNDRSMPAEDRDSFIEELCVRRELSINFVHYCPHYDTYECLPGWAKKSLAEQRNDKRYHTYIAAELEKAKTHDPYWNAAQREMNLTGYMHNYMRMYWGKKVLEWSDSPEGAYKTLLHLNNKLFLCGRDPNAYANVGWIFGLHDRAWGPRRPIFGLVRYMNSTGLDRKFDMEAYVKKVAALE